MDFNKKKSNESVFFLLFVYSIILCICNLILEYFNKIHKCFFQFLCAHKPMTSSFFVGLSSSSLEFPTELAALGATNSYLFASLDWSGERRDAYGAQKKGRRIGEREEKNRGNREEVDTRYKIFSSPFPFHSTLPCSPSLFLFIISTFYFSLSLFYSPALLTTFLSPHTV